MGSCFSLVCILLSALSGTDTTIKRSGFALGCSRFSALVFTAERVPKLNSTIFGKLSIIYIILKPVRYWQPSRCRRIER